MKILRKIGLKLAVLIPALALFVGVACVNSACYTFFHQPETPTEMDAYRK